MKPPSQARTAAFTLTEMLVVITCVVVLVFFLLPFLSDPSRAMGKSRRITCVNNLKNLGLAFRVFAGGHGAQWPMDVAGAKGGTAEYVADSTQLWRHWVAVTGELSSPKLLVCPSDRNRSAAASFAPVANEKKQLTFGSNQQLSYFLGLNSSEKDPQSILAGDRNVTTNGIPLATGRHVLEAGALLGFTEEMHHFSGNILLGDGSVQQVTSGRFTGQFQDALKSANLTTNVWLIP